MHLAPSPYQAYLFNSYAYTLEFRCIIIVRIVVKALLPFSYLSFEFLFFFTFPLGF